MSEWLSFDWKVTLAATGAREELKAPARRSGPPCGAGREGQRPRAVRLLESVEPPACPLLIIADDLDGEALATPVVNKLRGGLR